MRELDCTNELTSPPELADAPLPSAIAPSSNEDHSVASSEARQVQETDPTTEPESTSDMPVLSEGTATAQTSDTVEQGHVIQSAALFREPEVPSGDDETTEPSDVAEEVLSDNAARELLDEAERNGSEPMSIVSVNLPPSKAESKPEPPGIPAVLDVVRALNDQVTGRLEVIQALVERELRAEATRERVVDRLHAELQEYKQDLLLKVMRPVFVDLIQLHDDIGKMEDARASAGAEEDPELDPVKVLLESIRTGIEDILYRQGVEPFQEEQTTFDARRQRAITTVPTEDPQLNKTVAARIRKGFQSGEKVIRPEIVSVYTVKK